VPELLRNAVDKALEKEPADRYQTMQDLVADLRRATRKSGTQTTIAPTVVRRGSRAAWLAAGAALGVVVGGAAVLGTLRLRETPPPQPTKRIHFTISVPGYVLNGLSISPDGSRIAYASVANGTRQIWLRPIDSLEARPLAGADNANWVFWSPDGRYLGFASEGKLKKLDVNGGPAQTIAELKPQLAEGTWSRNGTILYNTSASTFGLALANGESKSWPAQSNAGDTPRVLPEMLPDGDHFLYVSPAQPLGTPGRTLFVGSMATDKWSRLADFPVGDDVVPNNLTATRIYYADGYVLYLLAGNGGTLSALPFDAAALAVRGAPVPVAEHVAEFSVSQTGVLVYRELPAGGVTITTSEHHLVWVDRRGERIGGVATPPAYQLPALSPDGRTIAVEAPAQNGLGDVWTVDAVNGTPTRLTFDDAADGAPVWSPDGAQLAFNSGRKSALKRTPSSLYRRSANGTGNDELLLVGATNELLVPHDWTPDGRTLLFARTTLTTWQERIDLWALDLSGERTARPIIESQGQKKFARFSPDGRWLAYDTNESKRSEIVVQPFPDVGRGKWQISANGGAEPRWRRDGRELYYLAPNNDLMAVDVDTTGDTFTSGAPHVLFATGVPPTGPNTLGSDYDVAPEGQRFLLNLPGTATVGSAPQPAPAPQPVTPELPLHVIVNWTTGLDKH
jgi:Tol biopolymer transport system component